MIKTEKISANALKIIFPDKLKTNDFDQIAQEVGSIINQHGKIRLLIDASGFHGWENLTAFEKHIGFVKAHQQKIERIAVIAGHEWQQWLIGTFRIFVHPEIKTFSKSQENEALEWLDAKK
jgi:hypothetical protein